jgi:hypothetical protein
VAVWNSPLGVGAVLGDVLVLGHPQPELHQPGVRWLLAGDDVPLAVDKLVNQLEHRLAPLVPGQPGLLILPRRRRTGWPQGRKPARGPAAASAARTTPAPKSTPTGGISLEDIRAVKGLVDRIGADKVQELAGMLSR